MRLVLGWFGRRCGLVGWGGGAVEGVQWRGVGAVISELGCAGGEGVLVVGGDGGLGKVVSGGGGGEDGGVRLVLGGRDLGSHGSVERW